VTLARDVLVRLDDAELLTQCDIDTYRASGPGGQKRNKTSSAVRLRHAPTGLIVIAEESRSQHENKAKALRRLRQAFVLHLREPLPTDALAELRRADGRVLLSPRHPDYWPMLGVLLDAFAQADGQLSTAAATLGLTTAHLGDLLAQEPNVWQEANRLRQLAGHKPLRQ
jgi:hypothetical protein